MLTLSPAILSHLNDEEIWSVRLVDLQIGDTTYYISDHYRAISVGAITYLPNGSLLGIDEISATTRENEDTVTISLSGVESAFRADVLDADAIGGTVNISRGFISTATGDLIDTPINNYSGVIYSLAITEEYPVDIAGSTTTLTGFTISVDVRSTAFRLGENPGRFTNDPSNRAVDSTDRSMEFVASLDGRNVRFGGDT